MLRLGSRGERAKESARVRHMAITILTDRRLLSASVLVMSAGLWLVTFVANVLTATFFTLLMFAVYMDRRTATPIVAPPTQLAPPPPQHVFCPSCGTLVASEDIYCVNCGRKTW